MKNIYFVVLIFCFSGAAAQTGNWKLVWSDEFNYTGRPDSTKWTYEHFTRRNRENQIYTDNLKNVSVGGGFLTITGYKEEATNPRYVPNTDEWYSREQTFHYTSGSITTLNKASWTSGKIEVRAKVPAGKGTWPAIWLLGVDKEKVGWPRQGEIDIMEHLGRFPKRSTGTLHFADRGTFAPVKTGDNVVELDKPLSDDFHIYGVEWDSTKVTLFVDRKPFFSYKLQPFMFKKHPFYLILNQALGGTAGGEIDDTIFPSKFVIDYVRVYQH